MANDLYGTYRATSSRASPIRSTQCSSFPVLIKYNFLTFYLIFWTILNVKFVQTGWVDSVVFVYLSPEINRKRYGAQGGERGRIRQLVCKNDRKVFVSFITFVMHWTWIEASRSSVVFCVPSVNATALKMASYLQPFLINLILCNRKGPWNEMFKEYGNVVYIIQKLQAPLWCGKVSNINFLAISWHSPGNQLAINYHSAANHLHSACIQPAISWHSAGNQPIFSWQSAGIQLAISWQLAGNQQAISWHTVGN